MVEVGGGVAAKVSPPFLDLGVGDSLGLPAPRLPVPGGRRRRRGRRRSARSGELLVKGPGVLAGLLGRARATAEALTDDGWLRTGDLVGPGRSARSCSPVVAST